MIIKPEWNIAHLVPDTTFMKHVYSKFTRT